MTKTISKHQAKPDTKNGYERTAEHGDLFVYYMEQKRRSLITELRSLDELLGRPQTIPTKGR